MNSFVLIAAIQLSKTNAVMPKLFLKHLIFETPSKITKQWQKLLWQGGWIHNTGYENIRL